MSQFPVIALESYLDKTRQLSKLGQRQARMLSARMGAFSEKDSIHCLFLLLLHWWERGAAAVNIQRLLEPIQNEALRLQSSSLEQDWDISWNDLSQDTSLRSLFTSMLQNPTPWAPLLGTNQALVIVDQEKQEFSFARAWEAVRRLEESLRSRLQPLSPLTQLTEQTLQTLLGKSLASTSKRYHYRQVAACALAMRTKTLILSGGPGTGKTSVVMEILRVLLAQDPTLQEDRIALCAPTGRAKARMGETVQVVFPKVSAFTLHGLLVQRPDGSFRHHKENPLPYRVVVVDEASMVDLHIFAALLDAVAADTHLILLGDMHQLPSVDAGAVLGDLTEGFERSETLGTLRAETDEWLQRLLQSIPNANPLQTSTSMRLEPAIAETMGALVDHTVILDHTYRSTIGIQLVCRQINRGKFYAVMELLAKPEIQTHVALHSFPEAKAGVAQIENWWNTDADDSVYKALWEINLQELAAKQLLAKAFDTMLQSRVLVLSHKGPLGRIALNKLAENHFRTLLDPGRHSTWFHGQHVLLGHNHHDLGLFNGDLGLMVKTSHGLQVVFRRSNEFAAFSPDLLVGLESAYAMTVHKSQGSEFGRVLLVLPDHDTPLLNRQIIYTGITRAKEYAQILGSPEILRKGIERRDERPGGIRI